MTAKPEMPDELYVRRSHTDGKHFSAVMTDSPLIAGRTKYRRADSPSPATEIDILDVIEWADGVKAALNSELASRVAREEAEIAYAINQAVSKQALSAPVAHKKGWGKIPHPSDDIYEDVKSGVSVAQEYRVIPNENGEVSTTTTVTLSPQEQVDVESAKHDALSTVSYECLSGGSFGKDDAFLVGKGALSMFNYITAHYHLTPKTQEGEG